VAPRNDARAADGSRGDRAGRGIAAVVVATGTTAIGILPMFLVIGMFVVIGPELGFGERELGIAVGGCYAVSALVAPYAGVIGDRLGPRRALRIGVTLSAVCAVGMALAPTFPVLVALMLVAGGAIAINQMAGNVLLVSAGPPTHQALAFATKQSAVPFASLIGGAALPLIGLTLGWRWALTLPALLLGLLLVPIPELHRPVRKEEQDPVDLLALVLLAIGAASGVAAANAAATFLVPYAVSIGSSPGRAGTLLAIGGALGVGARLVAGWVGDRFRLDGLTVTAVLIASGTVGFLLLVLAPRGPLLVVAVVIAFGAGWGWSGIFTHAVAASYPRSTGRVTGISQSGIFAGGMFGPAIFGVVVAAAGYRAAWWVAVGFAISGGLLITLGRQRLRRDLGAVG
jgi:MFS family permease